MLLQNPQSLINRLFPQMIMEFVFSFTFNVKGKATVSNAFRNLLTNTVLGIERFFGILHYKENTLQLWYFHVSLPDSTVTSSNPLFCPNKTQSS